MRIDKVFIFKKGTLILCNLQDGVDSRQTGFLRPGKTDYDLVCFKGFENGKDVMLLL